MIFDGADLYQWAAAADVAGDPERARMLRAEAATRPYRSSRKEAGTTFGTPRDSQVERRRGQRRRFIQPPYFGERRCGNDRRGRRQFDHRIVNP